MRQRHLFWNTSSFCWIVIQHSAPHRRKLNTLLLKILILVWTLKTGGSPYRFLHRKSLVGITDPGVDHLVTVTGCCHICAKIGEFFNIFKVFSINHDRVVHSSVLPHNLGLLGVDFETNIVGCFAKMFSFLFDILVLD